LEVQRVADSELPPLASVEQALAEASISVDAAELHGSICGLLSAGGRLAGGDWLEALAIEGPRIGAGSVLDRLRSETLQQLSDSEFGFDLLLPEDGADLGDRVEALSGWCRGFLGGFGLGISSAGKLSDEAREALEDLARIAQSELSFEDGEDDENALSEIIEFVRVAVLLLHSEGGGSSANSTLH
jgi:uncharacterized protein YgfB (UPF0149 family)